MMPIPSSVERADAVEAKGSRPRLSRINSTAPTATAAIAVPRARSSDQRVPRTRPVAATTPAAAKSATNGRTVIRSASRRALDGLMAMPAMTRSFAITTASAITLTKALPAMSRTLAITRAGCMDTGPGSFDGREPPFGIGGDDAVGGLAVLARHRCDERRLSVRDDPGVLAGAAGNEAGADRNGRGDGERLPGAELVRMEHGV